MNQKQKDEIICYCLKINKKTILKAIDEGAQTLSEIYEKTTAGTGPCGGSCRRKILKLLTESE